MWKFECSRVKKLLALHVGQDLSEQHQADAEQHVAQCAHCREHLERVQAGHDVLEQVRAHSVVHGEIHGVAGSSPVRSVWPELKAKLLAQQARAEHESLNGVQRFNGWLPIGALAAACIAILVVADSGPPVDRPQFADQTMHMVQPVVGPPPRMQPYRPLYPHQPRYDGGRDLNFHTEPATIDPSGRIRIGVPDTIDSPAE